MYVYGQLVRAAAETLSADPSVAGDKFTGRLFFNSTTGLLKVIDASAVIKKIRTDETTAQTIVQNAAAANVTGLTIDSALYTSVKIGLEIVRGTTLFFSQNLNLQYMNSAWVIREGDLVGEGDATDSASGLTWSKTGTTIAQLKVAAEANANNTIIKWKILELYDA